MEKRYEDQIKRSNRGRLEGKVAIITGSAEGMGAASAKLFALEGAKVIVADINEAKGEHVAAHICRKSGDASFIRLDVTDEDNWKSVMIETVKKYEKLNILVNNAGIIEIAEIEDTSLQDWNRIMEVNATGPFLGTKHAIQTMKANGELCSIINRSSIAGQIGDKNMFA
jgi:NAD(P)-dependent dehydrogenase (short-subunit alcohol dehydrogenase family)